MSVVNQMLRDLENNAQPHQTLDMQSVESKRAFPFRLIAMISFAIALSATAYAFWPSVKSSDSEKQLDTPLAKNTQTLHEKNQENIKHTSQIQANDKETLGKPIQQVVNTEKPLKHAAIAKATTQESVSGSTLPVKPVQPETTKTQEATATSVAVSASQINSAPQIIAATPTPNTQRKAAELENDKPTKQSEHLLTDTQPVSTIKKQSIETRRKKELQQIKNNYRINGYPRTKELLTDFLNRHSDFHTARLYFLSLAQQNHDPLTTGLLTQAVDDFPKISSYRLAAARYFFSTNEYQKAEELLIDTHKEQANYFDLLHMRALNRQKMGQHQLAIKDYSQILKTQPNRGDIYLAIGISFDAIGNHVQAKRSFQNALSDRRLSQRQKQFAESKIDNYQG